MSTLYDVRAGDLIMLKANAAGGTRETIGLFGIPTASLYVPSSTIVLLLETPSTEAIEAVHRQINNTKATSGPDTAHPYRYAKVLYEEAIYEVWLGNIGSFIK
ncbi:MAG: hypothetical protein WC761_00120 [Candidatus Paceibacterota bacterium]|jgi:hypothetical protein